MLTVSLLSDVDLTKCTPYLGLKILTSRLLIPDTNKLEDSVGDYLAGIYKKSKYLDGESSGV